MRHSAEGTSNRTGYTVFGYSYTPSETWLCMCNHVVILPSSFFVAPSKEDFSLLSKTRGLINQGQLQYPFNGVLKKNETHIWSYYYWVLDERLCK